MGVADCYMLAEIGINIKWEKRFSRRVTAIGPFPGALTLIEVCLTPRPGKEWHPAGPAG
jgi:hypothetical protein